MSNASLLICGELSEIDLIVSRIPNESIVSYIQVSCSRWFHLSSVLRNYGSKCCIIDSVAAATSSSIRRFDTDGSSAGRSTPWLRQPETEPRHHLSSTPPVGARLIAIMSEEPSEHGYRSQLRTR
jgi:hypothetical protein